jgi:hypothetical protein
MFRIKTVICKKEKIAAAPVNDKPLTCCEQATLEELRRREYAIAKARKDALFEILGCAYDSGSFSLSGYQNYDPDLLIRKAEELRKLFESWRPA